MSHTDVAVIDYGVGNLLSVRRALEYCGATVVVSSEPGQILEASRVVLPGVGAFADAMQELRRRELDVVVREVTARNTPLLGICLGMQMLLDESEEFGVNEGLGIIPGRVVPVPAKNLAGQPQKIPHIGWNALVPTGSHPHWDGTILQDLKAGDSVYFVHSFMAEPTQAANHIANCLYGDVPVSAVIGKGKTYGCQFHPEKSGEVGLKVLKRFLTL